jgi:electron transfer flavoprotein alpha subunit
MKNIIVFLEARDASSLKRSSYEALTAAAQCAASTGATITGFAVNASAAALQTAGHYGVSTVVNASHALLSNYSSSAAAECLAQYAKNSGADCVIMSGNSTGREIAPRLSIKLSAGLLPDCVELRIENGAAVAMRPVYAGKARIAVKTTTAISVITLRPNVFTARTSGSAAAAIQEFTPQLSDAHVRVRVESVTRNEGRLDVAEADIIVSGGRGLKGPEHFNLVEDLASTLGAAVGASRAVVDAGWRPHTEQVGQTGKTVSPSLYVACGISGAVQHLAGMSSSKVILAINKDKEAPIFKVADYGIVGDVFEVLPRLNSNLKNALGK